jgi:hypothetical protein
MRKVYSTTILSQAEILRVVLRKNGIESLLENENAAMYAAGVPIPAIPFVISVDDKDAEEAARIIDAELRRPQEPLASAIHLRVSCLCGKTLEYPQGDDPPDECPWCGRELTAAAPPAEVPPSKRTARAGAARFVFIVCILIGVIVAIRYRGGPGKSSSSDDASVSHAEWSRRLRVRISAIPEVAPRSIDPGSIIEPLAREFPEDAATFSAVFDSASSPAALIERWIAQLAELSPDWGLAMGIAESVRLTPWSTTTNRKFILKDALALQKLRSFPTFSSTVDGRLFERELEQTLLWHALYGAELRDPRAPLWSVRASDGLKHKPALLAERLERVPDQIRALRATLPGRAPKLWIEAALSELNGIMELLRDWETSIPDKRLHAALLKVRNDLSDYAGALHAAAPNAPPLRDPDPRWIAYSVREAEFSDRTVRQAADLLLDLSDRSEAGWRSWSADRDPPVRKYGFSEWREVLRGLTARARVLTVERGFVDVPPGDLPDVIPSPHASTSRDPYYENRPFAPASEATLRLAPWEGRVDCSPETALISLFGETYPGRYLHGLYSRRDASRFQRIYSSFSLQEGWREYCRRWAVEPEPSPGNQRASADGYRYILGFLGAVELCYLSGTLTESEALRMMIFGIGETEGSAKGRLAWATMEPLYTTQALLGEHDLTALREELKTKLGGRFDLKAFHTRLLGYGQTPTALIREEMLREEK